jgi:cyclopropane fatty-acyl-phospholipid synthase-like methyltransferase
MLPCSEACERNKGPILEVLRTAFAERSQVLEIGSGTGQHAVHFAAHLPHLTWHPTEQLGYLADLTARVKLEGPPNLKAPAVLDVKQAVWPLRIVDAVFTANTMHIMAWSEVITMYQGIGAVLAEGGVMCAYGPFRYQGRYTSDSNEAFDRMLKERDPKSGLRDLEDLTALAAQYGLRLHRDHDLPANNRLLEFVKDSLEAAPPATSVRSRSPRSARH